MTLQFTKGVTGIFEDSHIVLKSANTMLKTDLLYEKESMFQLQKTYNIIFLGEIDKHGDIKHESDYNIIIGSERELSQITSMQYNFESYFVEIEDLIRNIIFQDMDKYYAESANLPIFISTEGLEPFLFFEKSEFNTAFCNSQTLNFFPDEDKYRYIYLHDILDLIQNFKNYVYCLPFLFIDVEEDLCHILDNMKKHYFDLLKSGTEFAFSGFDVQIMATKYMSVITKFCSSLDLLAKIVCELTNIPSVFTNRSIRFHSGSIYFSNLGRFKNVFEKYNSYKNSVVFNMDSYNDIIQNRNLIVHNSFFSSIPKLFWGQGSSVVNNQDLFYATLYLWDVDDEGKPERWMNRSKFYGQHRIIDDYLSQYILKYYYEIENTLKLFIEFLKDRYSNVDTTA
jgi:hypothetical protein